jgi:aryl-alcohol dehydrogenase-like predicted oxidoreductase
MSGFESAPLWPGGPRVGPIGLGTVELGMAYGTPGEALRRPTAREATRVIHGALERGVTLLDTARGYGLAEARIGRALAGRRDDAVIATKMGLPREAAGEAIYRAFERSLRTSLRALRTDRVELLQLHSATASDLRRDDVLDAVRRISALGLTGAVGATIYEPADIEAALAAGVFASVQAPVHALLPSIVPSLEAAQRAGVTVMARSVVLRGILSPRAAELTPALAPLSAAARSLADAAGTDLAGLPAVAYRWTLGRPAVVAALVGTASLDELDAALAAAALGPLDDEAERRIRALAAPLPSAVDPRTWPA